jgi:hypothetical protein
MPGHAQAHSVAPASPIQVQTRRSDQSSGMRHQHARDGDWVGRASKRGSRHASMLRGNELQGQPQPSGGGFLRQEGSGSHSRVKSQTRPGGFVRPERDSHMRKDQSSGLRYSSSRHSGAEDTPSARRSLWAGKDGGSSGGLNRWDTVSLSDDRSTQKFQRLMGAQPDRADPSAGRGLFVVQSEHYYEQVANDSAVSMAQAAQQQRYHRTSGLQ